MKGLYSILFLIISNIFMTLAWYGHLRLRNVGWFSTLALPAVIVLSWSLALFEYAFQVPANRMGFDENGGPFNLWQLKVIQEVITLIVFTVFTLTVFREQSFRWNYAAGFGLLIGAVYLLFAF
jgi:uncharacterized protein (DUF486 family)